MKLVPFAALLLLVVASPMAAWLNPSRIVRDVGFMSHMFRRIPARVGTRLLSVASVQIHSPTQRVEKNNNNGKQQLVAPPSEPPVAGLSPSQSVTVPRNAALVPAATAPPSSLPALRPEPEAAPEPVPQAAPVPEPVQKLKRTALTVTGEAGAEAAVAPARKASIVTDNLPITVVDTEEKARMVLRVLESADANIVWACDTEVADIDLKEQGPVGNGKVTCVSIYGGPSIDFGTGEGRGSVLWVENIDKADGLLQLFKGWFEDPTKPKVCGVSHAFNPFVSCVPSINATPCLQAWHNYGFDRHVLNNEGIDVKGFVIDTMHMARLVDTARDKMSGNGTGYSLEALSDDYLPHFKVRTRPAGMCPIPSHIQALQPSLPSPSRVARVVENQNEGPFRAVQDSQGRNGLEDQGAAADTRAAGA